MAGEPVQGAKGVALPPAASTSAFGSWWPEAGSGTLGALMAGLRPPPAAEVAPATAARHVQGGGMRSAEPAGQHGAADPSAGFVSWWDEAPLGASPAPAEAAAPQASASEAAAGGRAREEDSGLAAAAGTAPGSWWDSAAPSVPAGSGEGFVSVPEALLQRYHELEAWAQQYEHWNWAYQQHQQQYQQWQQGYQQWHAAQQQYQTYAAPPAAGVSRPPQY